MVLVVFGSVCVLIGGGMSLVDVDYKGLVVGSRIGEMGFML
ncbi:proton-conducting transporter transmembrane domain-containing protein, partial [Staphylococcus saprophyticus]